MRKKRIFGFLIGLLLVIIGGILITEGGFRISHITYDELPNYVAPDMVEASPCILEHSEQKDVVISVYMDKNNKNSFYILEFARNMIFNRYSLIDTHICTLSDQKFNSVVSTAFYDYAYSVDLPNLSIDIFEKNLSGTPFYSLFLIFLGCAMIVDSQKKKST